MSVVRSESRAEVDNATAAPAQHRRLRDAAKKHGDRIAADRGTMGEGRSGWLSRSMLLLTFIGMAGSVVAMAVSYIKG
jgi:hypothetical protein